METNTVSAWPIEWTEEVAVCPVCSSGSVSKRDEKLIDWFSVPPSGNWQFSICSQCGSGYLSKRPKCNYIQHAYKNYYTHDTKKDGLYGGCLRVVQKFLYERFCDYSDHKLSLSSCCVYFLARLAFPLGLYFDAKSRHIFKIKCKGRILDVGCGNGEFLALAQKYGWEVKGIDFDKDAIRAARKRGLDVTHGGIDIIEGHERFDFISMGHVIEHVYDPRELIRKCLLLLNPGGVLWLESPNVESIGYYIYASNWRGLEPPRHLVLFNMKSISELFAELGVNNVTQKCHALSGVYTGLCSEEALSRQVESGSLIKKIYQQISMVTRIFTVETVQLASRHRREYLTLVVIK